MLEDFCQALYIDQKFPHLSDQQKVNKLKNHFYAAAAPADVTAGVIWIDSDDDKVYRYDGAAWSQFYTVADPNPNALFHPFFFLGNS